MKKQKKKINIIITIINIISIAILIFSLYHIYIWYNENKNTSEILKNVYDNTDISYQDVTIDDVKTTILDIDFSNLKNTNPDTVAWLEVPGTDINYPVVQTVNNDYYLTHSFDKSYSKAGWVFADYTNSSLKNEELDRNNVIYGHNRKNNSIFGTLPNILKDSWRNKIENRFIKLSTPNNNFVWQVFSTYTIESENYYIKTHFSSDEEFSKFIQTLKNRSNYNYNIDVSINDKILTLSTCSNIGDGRIVVHAKLLNIQ